MRRLLVGVVTAGILAACGAVGPGGATSNDPVGAVTGLVQLIEAKRFTEVAGAVCAAKQAEVTEQSDPTRRLASSVPGLDATAARDAMTISFADLRVSEESRNGSTAVVRVQGTMNVSFDGARMRQLLAPAVEQQGLSPATLNRILSQVAAQSIPIDSQLEVVNENGVWLVCDSLARRGPAGVAGRLLHGDLDLDAQGRRVPSAVAQRVVGLG